MVNLCAENKRLGFFSRPQLTKRKDESSKILTNRFSPCSSSSDEGNEDLLSENLEGTLELSDDSDCSI